MLTWLIKRLFHAGLVILAMTVILFVGLHMIGNPVDVLVHPDATQAERVRLISEYGLDQPLWRQYLIFVANALQGDLGRSFVFNEPALQLVLSRMPATLELAVTSMLMAFVVGIPLGLFAGLRPHSGVSRMIMAGSVLAFSLPTFWVGLVLIMTFSVHLGWLPTTGRGDTVTVFGIEWSFLTRDGLMHIAMPALNLALFNVALVLRLTRAGVREVAPSEYVRFARAKGISEGRIVGVHILKNIAIPIITVTGIEFGSTVAFAVVTESIFAWPGMGKLFIDSVNLLDRPVIVAYLIVTVILFTTINLVVDLVYSLIDPRIRATATAGIR
jgi:peptide/nickel transport system permease protein